MKHWLFNCREISQLVSRSMDENTPLYRRLGIRFHMMMCRYCSRYEKQLDTIQQTIQSIGALNTELVPKTMSSERKQIIKKSLAEK
jgi:hypothetical protein